ncbi:MAG: excinuclease ABC subunit UvrA [Candidatus Dormibacteraeota bacterium]|nr:excinuclease ABC subunit UvrA [Candidatus Dormibacteraeota bacterium]
MVIKGAREHNLKDIDLTIPRDKLVVFTGLSGSGKSSLAFDTIYAEGQRRYVESLSSYARQFLGQMDKPDVDQIDGLSPAISIDQKGTSHNPRSTVGTVTEIYDYLRLMYARIGHPHCPISGHEISRQTTEQIADRVMELPAGSRVMILAPVIRDRKGEHHDILVDARKAGFVRARVDGNLYELTERVSLDKNKKHNIEIVVDRLVIEPEGISRLRESVETAAKMASGLVLIVPADGKGEELLFSQNFACPYDGFSMEELAPRNFSFNNPHGACPACTGLGSKLEVDPDLVIPDKTRSISDGAIRTWGRSSYFYNDLVEAVAQRYKIPMDRPFGKLSVKERQIILHGNNGDPLRVKYFNSEGKRRWYETSYEGIVPNLERRHRETESEFIRAEIERMMSPRPCEVCKGKKLKPEYLAVTIHDRSIIDVSELSISAAQTWFKELQLPERDMLIARAILKEIRERLSFLVDVGLEYLSLSRAAESLSGGEAQRIRLATQIGSKLMGVLYILDEPSIGLHQRDNKKLINTLLALRDIGNTVVVIEHDEETIRTADFIADIGPGAGEHGGRVVATGTIDDILKSKESITGAFLRGERSIPMPARRRKGNGSMLVVRGATENNLKNIDVYLPLGKLICVSGVSGSGKSSLVSDILYRRLAQHFYRAKERPGAHREISGLGFIDKVINVDQSPIGRTPRSNPATYTGVFTYIRDLYAQLPEARMRGYKAGRFSFNVKGGRCENCEGDGIIKIEMHFLPDVYVPCEVCKGKRYNREALEVRYRGKSIADVLDMSVEEAAVLFENIPRIRRKLQTLVEVGLGYIRLGQPATQLSGGEAQRVKLTEELSRRDTGRTFYILDEPTTGLHFADVERLLSVLHRLVDAGNTVLVIEHNLDVLKTADHLIDLGPEGGEKGGQIVAVGTPEEIARNPRSFTGHYLKTVLGRELAIA